MARTKKPQPASDVPLPAWVVEKLARLETLEADFEFQLEQAKLAALKEFAYGAGHEINNPLANISARAQTLLKDERDPQRRRKLAAVVSQAARANEMIADLMLFARPPLPVLQAVDLAELVKRLLAQLSDDAAERNVKLEFRGEAAPVTISADATQISQALRALCINAFEAIGRDGQVTIELHPVEQPSPGVEIRVSDSGPGIAPAHRPHLFDPFFSGREAGRGLGFGLCKAWRIITDHGGTLRVDDSVTQGAAFVAWLPTVQKQD